MPRRQSVDEAPPPFSPPPQPSTPLITDDDFIEPPPVEETQSLHGQQTYRKPPTPRQPGNLEQSLIHSISLIDDDSRSNISPKETTS